MFRFACWFFQLYKLDLLLKFNWIWWHAQVFLFKKNKPLASFWLSRPLRKETFYQILVIIVPWLFLVFVLFLFLFSFSYSLFLIFLFIPSPLPEWYWCVFGQREKGKRRVFISMKLILSTTDINSKHFKHSLY